MINNIIARGMGPDQMLVTQGYGELFSSFLSDYPGRAKAKSLEAQFSIDIYAPVKFGFTENIKVFSPLIKTDSKLFSLNFSISQEINVDYSISINLTHSILKDILKKL